MMSVGSNFVVVVYIKLNSSLFHMRPPESDPYVRTS